jgi:FixJ family two-component response regulator
MRGMSGLDLQHQLKQRSPVPQVIIITGHGDVPMAVRAVKAGAIQFLEKPVNDQLLLECIRTALERDARVRAEWSRRSEVAECLSTLTRRESEVMELIIAGHANKQVAGKLGISERTVEVHRKRILYKMQARNAVELARVLASHHAAD